MSKQQRIQKAPGRLAWSATALALLAAFPGLAAAQYTSTNRDVLAPNTGAWSTSGVTLGGTTFVNLGLQGVGRVAANSIDSATGETLGSISDMQITSFAKTSDTSWSGTFNFLPDRGYNSGAIFSNYAARINVFDFTFTPYTGTAAITTQDQIAMSFKGSIRFTYDHDNNPLTAPVYTTGLLATGTASLFGTTAPTTLGDTTQGTSTVNNRLTLDAEGLILDNRAGKAGSGWVGDEYGAYIYRFESNKEIVGQLQVPAALVPHSPANTINFNANPEVNGRRINQGMEGIAQSPDGTKLFGLLQSATIQDSTSATGNAQGRSNTRLLVYDISGSDTPGVPSKQYVIQLPLIDDNGGTPAVNRTGAQSSIIALNDHQLLILSRDGNGRGVTTGSPVFKSILLADISDATNITGFDAEGAAIAPSGVLNASVKPIQWTEALNMLGKLGSASAIELAKFGLNLNPAPSDPNTISEKWEAMGLVPVGDGSGDYFLFVGNDNDFQTATGKYLDANGVLQSYNAGLENDTMVLAYRVAAVPEPETYAMLLAGLALIGAVSRRRRLKAS